MRKRFMQRYHRELHRQSARQHHAALHRVNQLRHIAMAGIKAAEGIGDADDRTIQRLIGIAHRLDKCFAQKQGEFFVAVSREAFAHAAFGSCHGFLLGKKRVWTIAHCLR